MDNFSIKKFANAAFWMTIGMAAGLAFSLALGYWGPVQLETVNECRGGDVYCFFQAWQTLITGAVAILVAFYTWQHMREESRVNAWLKFREMMRDYTMAQSQRHQYHMNLRRIRDTADELNGLEEREQHVDLSAVPNITLHEEAKPRREFNALYCDDYLTALKACEQFRTECISLFNQRRLTAGAILDLLAPIEVMFQTLLDAAIDTIAEGAGEIRSWNNHVPERFRVTIRDDWAPGGRWA